MLEQTNKPTKEALRALFIGVRDGRAPLGHLPVPLIVRGCFPQPEGKSWLTEQDGKDRGNGTRE